eukprot:gene12148-13401_t
MDKKLLAVPSQIDGVRNQLKSRSLENLNSLSLQKQDKIPSNASPILTLRGLKKKLALKLSKSNQDVVGSMLSCEENKKLSHATVRPQHSTGSLAIERKSKDDRPFRSSLKLDNRKRSKTTDNMVGGQTFVSEQQGSSLQPNDGLNGRSRSFTEESIDQFVVVDNISIDESVDDYNLADGGTDYPDGGPPDNERASLEMEKLKQKINKTKQQLLEMQNFKADNVREFLGSTQDQKNKVNFEKKQQKTNANIQLLQRKIDKYQKMYRDYEERGVSQHRAKEMLRGMHDAVKAGASSISGAVSKPLESMNKLMKKDKRAESVDNLGTTGNAGGDSGTLHSNDVDNSYLGSSDEDNSSISSTNQLLSLSGIANAHPSIGSELDRYQNQNNEIMTLRKENEELRQSMLKLKEDLRFVVSTAEDERYRYEDLQSQVRDLFNQYNDLTELHQQEIMEVKEELYKASERIECVDYRSVERAGEIEEALDSCVTRISKMELQQQHQQQLLLSVDGYFGGSGTAKLLLSKVLSLVISLFAIVLVIVSLCARIISPFTSTWKRAVMSFSCLILLIFFWRNIDGNLQIFTRKISQLTAGVLRKLPTKPNILPYERNPTNS